MEATRSSDIKSACLTDGQIWWRWFSLILLIIFLSTQYSLFWNIHEQDYYIWHFCSLCCSISFIRAINHFSTVIDDRQKIFIGMPLLHNWPIILCTCSTPLLAYTITPNDEAIEWIVNLKHGKERIMIIIKFETGYMIK
jgi:hypothetical protein